MTADEVTLLMKRRPDVAAAIADYAQWLADMTREPGRFGRYEAIVQDSRVKTVHRTVTDQMTGEFS